MSEYDQLKAMLDRTSQSYKELDTEELKLYLEYHTRKAKVPVEAGKGFEIQNGGFGYAGFVGIWLFDINGNLLDVGHYE